MRVSSISNPNSNSKINFGAKHFNLFRLSKQDEVNLSNKTENKQEKEPLYKKFKTAFTAIISAIIAAGSVLLICQSKNNELKNANNKLAGQLKTLVLPENYDKAVSDKIKEIQGSELSYCPTENIQNDSKKNRRTNNNPVVVLPQVYKKTTNRSDAVKLNYPVFVEGKPYEFTFPNSREIKISKEHKNITPTAEILTNISESYADSLQWNDAKVARDLLQNFYDGHGQTLDGVKVSMKPGDNGKYTVRIQGKSTYLPDKAILLGESSKKDNGKAAGNYGEGLKMVVLKLLKEKGSENVRIASDNWKVDWKLAQCELSKKVLSYKLDKSAQIDGNYIEFDTDNIPFIREIINSFDRFYHYNNPAFKCPDFENEDVCIKLLSNENQDGKFFIAGQAFEIDGDYDGLKGMNINIKNKPPIRNNGELVFDPSRDRVSLTLDNMEALGSWIVSEKNMSKEEVVNLIHSLEKYWDLGTDLFNHSTKGTAFIRGIFKGAYYRNDLNIKFPDEKYVSDSIMVSRDLKNSYRAAGYKFCNSYFSGMGMPSIEDIVREARKHVPLEPTEKEKNKILILQQAIQLMAPVLLQGNFFTEDELKANIYIYNKNSDLENDSYKDVEGEAIIKDGKTLGFWLDREYLGKTDFSSAFSTSLHELSHKFGGDESAAFSYKLTDVLQKVFAAINDNPNLAVQMKVLEQAWNAQ